MLILKSPMKLQSINPILSYADCLGNKIRGNYQIMNLAITSEDLLHMMVTPPEIYLESGNDSTVLLQNHTQNVNQLKLEIVSQFLNRVRLYQTPQFTYQDEVFVTGLLQKMGIINVSEFMTQVKKNLEQNEICYETLKEYYMQGELVQQEIEKVFKEKELQQIYHRTEQTEKVTGYDLSYKIFERLHTAELSDTVYDYLTIQDTGEEAQKLTLFSSQIQQADAIQLALLRTYVLQQDYPVTWQTYHKYEQESIVSEELTEQKIMNRLSAAILENLIQQILYETFDKKQTARNFWQDYTQIMYGTAQDTLRRFETYQVQNQTAHIHRDYYDETMKVLCQEEQTLLKLIYQTTQQGEQNLTEEQSIFKKNTLIAILQNQNLQQQIAEMLHCYQVTEQYDDSEQSFVKMSSVLQALQIREENLKKVQKNYKDEYKDIHERIENQNQFVELKINQEKNMEEFIHTSIQNTVENHMPPEALQGAEKVELRRSLTENQMFDSEYLFEMNERNVRMSQLRNEQHIIGNTRQKVVINRKEAMEQARRGLEHPKEILQEIMDNSEAIKLEMPPEVERMLKLTDENTRQFYKTIMGYETDTTETMKDSIIEINEQKIQQILQRQQWEQNTEEGLEKVYLNEPAAQLSQTLHDIGEQETIRFFENKETHTERIKDETYYDTLIEKQKLIYQKIQQLPEELTKNTGMKKQVELTSAEDLEEIALIHHSRQQEQQELVEEVIETLSDKKHVLTKSIEQEQREQITLKQLQETKKEIMEQNEEKITQIVKRNLQTQMHTISDQVYQDLEKRLQNERRRRGY